MHAWIKLWNPKRLMQASVTVAVVTITLKTGAWWVSDSVGLLSDALESVVNLAGAMFGLAMVMVASRPADDGHPYGHHKAEYFSSGFEGILIVGAALAIVWAAVHRWADPQPLQQVGLGLARHDQLVVCAPGQDLATHSWPLNDPTCDGDQSPQPHVGLANLDGRCNLDSDVADVYKLGGRQFHELMVTSSRKTGQTCLRSDPL